MTLRRVLVLLVAFAALVAPAAALAQEPPPPPPPPTPPPAPPVIADGVTIAGLPVGGLTRVEASTAVHRMFDRPLRLRLRQRTLRVTPKVLGAAARVRLAMEAAMTASEGKQLPLRVVIYPGKLRWWVNDRARRFERAARDSRLYLRASLRPRITSAIPGRKLRVYAARLRIRRALVHHRRGPFWLPTRSLPVTITPRDLSPVIVIRRGSRRLYLYRWRSGHMKKKRVFPVAVGQPSYPTPLGRFHIVSKQRNPWWYPPAAGWASGASPIPPGPNNPLGTRWMGLSVGAVGIHGTPNSGSVGSFASHGCIRMHIGSAEWLFERVRIGTTVFIVGA